MMDQHYERVMPTLFGDGNGNQGVISRINDYLVRADEREKERIRQQANRDDAMARERAEQRAAAAKAQRIARIINIAIAIGMLIVAILTLSKKIQINLGENPGVHISTAQTKSPNQQITDGFEGRYK